MSSSTSTFPLGSTNLGDPEMLATEEQHLRLRSLSWILSHTNPNPARIDPGASRRKTESTFHRARNKVQRFMYETTELFAFLLERHHESISITPSGRNGSPLYVSRSYGAQPPRFLDHMEIDREELMEFGQVLGIPAKEASRYIYDSSTEPVAANTPTTSAASSAVTSTAGGDGKAWEEQGNSDWGQNEPAFFVKMSQVAHNDYPVPTDDDPYAVPSGYGQYLMRHVKAQISENIFLTDVSFKQHCGNIVDGIKRTHKAKDDPFRLSTEQTSLAVYVYLTSASGIHEKLQRGFSEFCFGRYLTISMKEVLDKDPNALRIAPQVYYDEMTVMPLPDDFRRLRPKQREALEDLLCHVLPKHGIAHEHLDPDAPGSLLNRAEFYDTQGRVMFHTLLTTIMTKLTEEVTSLVQAKRAAMQAQAAIRRGAGGHISEAQRDELAEKVTHHAKMTSVAFKMLDLLRTNFELIINSHVTWLCRVFGAYPEDYDFEAGRRPQPESRARGLFDGLAPLCRDIFERGWPASCMHWLKTLCLFEVSMKFLRRPLRPLARDNVMSTHVSHCEVVYLGITPAAHKTRMMPVRECLQSMGYTSVQIDDAVEWLVVQGSIPSAQAVDEAGFGGCVHAEALQILLMSLKTQKQRIELLPDEVAAWHEQQRRGSDGRQQKKKKSPVWLPGTAIISRILKDRGHALVASSPFCAGCRAILDYVARAHVLDGDRLIHRGSRAAWTQFDLPPWTPRDVMDVALNEAEAEVGRRMRGIISLAERCRRFSAMDTDEVMTDKEEEEPVQVKGGDDDSDWEDCEM